MGIRSRYRSSLAVAALILAACSGSEGEGTTTTTADTTTTAASVRTTTTTVAPTTPPPADGRAGTYPVTDYGAVANAKDDDSAAFQAAVDAAAAQGGVVVVPSVGGRRGYVLNSTVEVPSGVSIIGAPAGSNLDVGGPYSWPDTEISGVKIFARPSPATDPLFRLDAGTTVRGLWITYDEQPLPSDAELQDDEGEYLYRAFQEVRTFFVDEHVTPTGPTFYIERGDQVTIEHVVADRYYDFVYLKSGGPLRVDSVSLYGYHRGFTVEDSDAVNVFSNIEFGPTVGPFVPGEGAGAEQRTWVFGAIASQPANVGFHFGRSDGFVLDNISFSGGHTAVRLGAAFEYPVIDTLTADSFYTSEPGLGPWGQLRDLRVDNAAVGLHMVAPSAQAILMSNVTVAPGIGDGTEFPAVSGSGTVEDVGRQAFMVVEASYAAANNGVGGQVPAILATNVGITGAADANRFGEAAATVEDVNGRVFLVDGDLGMEINGFALGAPYAESHLVAAGDLVGDLSVRIRGYLALGRPEADRVVSEDGVEVLAGDIIVVQPPPTLPPRTLPPPTAPPTTAPPETTTTTTTTAPTTTSPPEPTSTSEP